MSFGMLDKGGELLKEAATLGGPEENLSYARHLRRRGQLKEAQAAAQQALDLALEEALDSPITAHAFSALAQILSAQGMTQEAVGKLQHSLSLVAPIPQHYTVYSRICDDLGIAYRNIGKLERASEAFNKSLEIRRKSGRPTEVAQSLINLSRLELEGNLDAARELLKEAADLLEKLPPSSLRANAETLAAEIAILDGLPDSAVEHAQSALMINRQIGNRRGEAVALFVAARSYRAILDHGKARECAESCLTVNQDLNNEFGVSLARDFLQAGSPPL